MTGLYDMSTIPDAVRLAMDMMAEASEADKAEIAALRRQLALYERDHAAMEVLRSHAIDAVSWESLPQPDWRAWSYGMKYLNQAEKSASEDPADAILKAAGNVI